MPFRLDYDLVVDDCCLLRTLCRAKVNLLTVYHDKYLPRLAILGDTSIERASVAIAEPAVVDLASTCQNDFVHTEMKVRVRQVTEHLQPITLLLGRVVTLNRRIKSRGHLWWALSEQLSPLLDCLDRHFVVVVDIILLALLGILLFFFNFFFFLLIGLPVHATRVLVEHGSFTFILGLSLVDLILLTGEQMGNLTREWARFVITSCIAKRLSGYFNFFCSYWPVFGLPIPLNHGIWVLGSRWLIWVDLVVKPKLQLCKRKLMHSVLQIFLRVVF